MYLVSKILENVAEYTGTDATRLAFGLFMTMKDMEDN